MRKKNPHARPVIEAFERGFFVLRILILVGFVLFLVSGSKQIQPNEAAIILRFGKLVGATRAEQIHSAGLLVALPFPVDEVIRVPIRDIRELTIDDFSPFTSGFGFMGSINPTEEGYCITGDQYIVQLTGTVKYQIADPVSYSLEEQNPEDRIRCAIVSETIRCIGEMAVDDVLVHKKKLLGTRVLERAQKRLNTPDSGVILNAFELNELIPPPAVKQAFDEVVSASIQKETSIREGEKYRAEQIPEAEAIANTMIRKAQSYRKELLSDAKSQVTAFNSLLEQYKMDPQIVRTRLFRETMEVVFNQVGQKYLLPKAADGQVPPTLRLILPGKDNQ